MTLERQISGELERATLHGTGPLKLQDRREGAGSMAVSRADPLNGRSRWDERGRLVEVTLPPKARVVYDYDALGRWVARRLEQRVEIAGVERPVWEMDTARSIGGRVETRFETRRIGTHDERGG